MQLRFFDYLVLIVAYMFVSLRGDKIMKLIKFDKLSSMIPLGRTDSSAFLHAILFVLILVALNALASQIAGLSGKESIFEQIKNRLDTKQAPYRKKSGCSA